MKPIILKNDNDYQEFYSYKVENGNNRTKCPAKFPCFAWKDDEDCGMWGNVPVHCYLPLPYKTKALNDAFMAGMNALPAKTN